MMPQALPLTSNGARPKPRGLPLTAGLPSPSNLTTTPADTVHAAQVLRSYQLAVQREDGGAVWWWRQPTD